MSSSKRPQKKQARARAAASGKAASARKPVARSRGLAQAAQRRTAKAPTRQARREATAATKPTPAAPPQLRPPAAPARPAIRLPVSAVSRLTIKPGPPQAARPQLELSTRPRPSGPRKLSEVDLDEDEVLIDAFDATLGGQRVRITAVLERTCVYLDTGGDRKLARKEDLLVEADKLPIRRRGLG